MEINEELAEKLRLIGVYYQIKNEPWRAKTFLTAAKKIEEFPDQILSGEQAREIRGIGKSVGAEIDALIQTGDSPRLQDLEKEFSEWKIVIDLLLGVYGIGPVQAKKFYDAGVRSLEDLSHQQLTKAQHLGLMFYHDLQERVPRTEIEELEELLEQAWAPFETEWEIVGSYRRGHSTSGDIDILIKQVPGVSLNDLVQKLGEIDSGNFFQEPLLVGVLAQGQKKFMGLIQIGDNCIRRLDILIVPQEEWPFALVYFTGSKEFNVEMRREARRQGMTLNEHSFRDLNSKQEVKFKSLEGGEPFIVQEEDDVFNVLGMEWVEPWDR